MLTTKDSVGFTVYDTWYCFSPVKNNLVDAAACMKRGLPPNSASGAEYDYYNWSNNILEKIGVEIERAQDLIDYSGINLAFGPRIHIDPSFGITYNDLRSKFEGKNRVS